MAFVFKWNCLNLLRLKRSSHCREISAFCRISDLLKEKLKEEDAVNVKGWIKSTRKMKDVIFLDVNDGSCSNTLQIVIPKNMKTQNMTFGSSVEIEGTLKTNLINKKIEVAAKSVKVLGSCDPTAGFPFAARKSYPDDYIRQFLHFRPRHSMFACMMRLRDAASRGLHEVLGNKGFIHIHTPILTANDCEGAGEVFLVIPNSEKLRKDMLKEGRTLDEAYFNSKAYLTVSGQLHLEAVVRGLCAVYTFGPVFRAENSRSRLHLSEFYMLEAELAFSEDLDDAMCLAEDLIRGAAIRILEKCSDDLTSLGKLTNLNLMERVEQILSSPAFSRVPYSEAVEVLQRNESHLGVAAPRHGESLSKEHELFLTNHLGHNQQQAFIYVTHWPAKIKPFYMRHCKTNPNQVLAFDLLGPVSGELCGGSVREPSPEVLEQRLRQEEGGEALLQGLQWYLDIRRHGNVPSSGFGLGFERFLQSLLGIPNIKDTLPFPRWPHNLRM